MDDAVVKDVKVLWEKKRSSPQMSDGGGRKEDAVPDDPPNELFARL